MQFLVFYSVESCKLFDTFEEAEEFQQRVGGGIFIRYETPIFKSLLDYSTAIDEICESKGWNEEKSESEWASLAHSEISEAFEEYRNNKPLIYEFNGKPEGMAVEYADCIIRILHWFARHKLNPDEIMQMKMNYNKTRTYRHGGKKC